MVLMDAMPAAAANATSHDHGSPRRLRLCLMTSQHTLPTTVKSDKMATIPNKRPMVADQQQQPGVVYNLARLLFCPGLKGSS
jgi:hypothetical protein